MKRLVKSLALLIAMTTQAAALDLTNMSETEKKAFGEAVRAYMLENPEIIVEVIGVLENRRAEEEAASEHQMVINHWDELYDDGYSHVAGNPEGNINIVEFIDYRCGYCRRAHPEVKSMLEGADDIRLVFKEYPILGEQSVIASRFAIATRMLFGGDAYEDVQDALMSTSGDYTDVALKRLASALELDGDAILAEMTSDAVSSEINRNRILGGALIIDGTPTFVLETEMIRGYVSQARFEAMVEEFRTQ